MSVSSSIVVKPLRGQQIDAHVDDLARLRVEVFYEFPYLYDGTPEEELEYLHHFRHSADAVLVAAFDGDRIVGVSTALPLADARPNFQKPFIEHGYDLARGFYLAESVLQKAYRGQGIGVRFFEEREAHAHRLGGFEYATFCSVVRPHDHPRRPPDYRDLEAFWRRRGYTYHPELITDLTWHEIDDPAGYESVHTMEFWVKKLEE